MIAKRHTSQASGFAGYELSVFFNALATKEQEFQQIIKGRIVLPDLFKSGQDQLRNDRTYVIGYIGLHDIILTDLRFIFQLHKKIT